MVNRHCSSSSEMIFYKLKRKQIRQSKPIKNILPTHKRNKYFNCNTARNSDDRVSIKRNICYRLVFDINLFIDRSHLFNISVLNTLNTSNVLNLRFAVESVYVLLVFSTQWTFTFLQLNVRSHLGLASGLVWGISLCWIGVASHSSS